MSYYISLGTNIFMFYKFYISPKVPIFCMVYMNAPLFTKLDRNQHILPLMNPDCFRLFKTLFISLQLSHFHVGHKVMLLNVRREKQSM